VHNGRHVWMAAMVCAVALGATGCGLAPEEYVPVTLPPTSSPAPSPAPVGDPSPGEFDVAEVIAVLRALPPHGEFAWRDTRGKKEAAASQYDSEDYETDPSQCGVIWDAFEMRFDDDTDKRPNDEPLTDALVSPILSHNDGPGWEGYRQLAYFIVRVLDEPERGRTDVVDAVNDAAESCADGWIVTSLRFSLDLQNVVSFAPLPELKGLPPDATAAAFHVIHGGRDVLPEVWVFATMNNVAISYAYALDPEIAESDQEHGLSLVVDILTALAESGAAD
jgi:hypothetical protein